MECIMIKNSPVSNSSNYEYKVLNNLKINDVRVHLTMLAREGWRCIQVIRENEADDPCDDTYVIFMECQQNNFERFSNLTKLSRNNYKTINYDNNHHNGYKNNTNDYNRNGNNSTISYASSNDE